MPTQRQIKIQYLIKRLRWKYRTAKADINVDMQSRLKAQKNEDILNNILWYSYPVVYLDARESQKECAQMIRARSAAKYRANKYIRGMADSYDGLKFVTLTFRDDVLESTSARTRHRYVTKFLKENFRDYIGNVDYGAKNGREHFHAVTDDPGDLSKVLWPYGFQNIKNVGNVSKISSKDEWKDRARLSGYLLKLANHAGKPNAGKIFHAKGLKEVDELPF